MRHIGRRPDWRERLKEMGRPRRELPRSWVGSERLDLAARIESSPADWARSAQRACWQRRCRRKPSQDAFRVKDVATRGDDRLEAWFDAARPDAHEGVAADSTFDSTQLHRL